MDHRKIYESHYGAIPIDEFGRTNDIHHLDGDHSNNSPKNLRAVTILEHYDIHYAQEDWGACQAMAMRMKISPEEKSRLATLAALKQVSEGKHHFLDKEKARARALKQVEEGKHNFLSGEISRKTQQKRITEGQHHFQDSEKQRKIALNRSAAGTHNFQHLKPWQCEYCGKEGKGGSNYSRYHGTMCKTFKVIL